MYILNDIQNFPIKIYQNLYELNFDCTPTETSVDLNYQTPPVRQPKKITSKSSFSHNIANSNCV